MTEDKIENPAESQQLPNLLSTYQNYDFIPGDKILFEDMFTDDADGEFPAHWELDKGQAVLNSIGNKKALLLSDGNYVYVSPRMKLHDYLTDPFTIEFDTYQTCSESDGCAAGLMTFFKTRGSTEDYDAYIQVTESEAAYYTDENGANFSMNGSLPAAISEDHYRNKWHHIALAYKNRQLKVYVDQYRVLVVPDIKIAPASIRFGGIAGQDIPLVLTDVRVASGGSMNMIGKKFTAAKIVTHGIIFESDRYDIRPQSMGTLNMIVGLMKSNPDLKFEIDGHTDNTGKPDHNLELSEQRARAVKAQLVKMGIDASRLSTKGFGDSRPVESNDTPEGRANNRRVEFVKD